MGQSGTILHIDEGSMVSVEEFKTHNSKIEIQVFPNPASQLINIDYSLLKHETVQLSVFDIHGRETTMLLNSVQPAGEHTVQFDISNLSAGIYFIKLKVGNQVVITKIVKIDGH